MAKKKPTRRTPKRPASSQGPSEAIPEPSGRRGTEGKGRKSLHGFEGPNATPLDQAQDLMDQAFGEADEEKRIAMARRALEICPDCADAYVLLAENADRRQDALDLYRKGVLAAERALGPEIFKAGVGEFWTLLATRPYMRARLGLADLLWTSGERDAAIGHLQEMLRLNPGDNQGVRYTLAGWLLNMDRFDELTTLLSNYDEPTAACAYTKALLGFRRDGDTPSTRKVLKEARQLNKHVPGYLTGARPLPREQPGLYRLGDENEAILYAASSMGGWKSIPGAVAWLKACATTKPRKRRAARPKGPLPLEKARLKRVPQAFDVWQADIQRFGSRIEIGGELVQPWMLVAVSRSQSRIVTQILCPVPPEAELVWDQLADAIQSPMVGEPNRPTLLQVRADERWDELKEHFEELNIAVETAEELDFLDFVLEELRKELARDQPPGLLEMPGIDPQKLARFYQAAAEFYARATWRKLGYESAIKVECEHLDSGPRYAVVMGQSGLTFGLALYDDLAILRKLWSSALTDEENARETVALTVTYDDESGIGDADLDAIEQFDWEVAGPEAYPAIFRKERGMSMRPPLGWELELMEACLRAIPNFVDTHPLDDTSRHDVTIPTASGERSLGLSWVEE